MNFLLITAIVCVVAVSSHANPHCGDDGSQVEPSVAHSTLDLNYGPDEDSTKPRNLIMMIPDGTSSNVFTMARKVLDPTHQKRLHIDELLSGTVKTHASDALVTDSAASATAYSTGESTYNGAVGVDVNKKPIGTILEAAKARGMVVGMIVTSRVTHATPACFAAHVDRRSKEFEIASQYVANGDLDFLLGGGKKYFTDKQLSQLKSKGFEIVYNKQELHTFKKQNMAKGNVKVFGLFSKSHMAYKVDRHRTEQPGLPQMVDTMMKIMKNNPKAKKNGFFIMIEGSRVDHAGHANDAGTMAKEALDFDQTVGVVKKYTKEITNTAMLAVPDHGTGGMTLGANTIYNWNPFLLRAQNMSTEWMFNQIEEVFDGCRKTNLKGSNNNCLAKTYTVLTELLFKYTHVKEISNEWKEIFNSRAADWFADKNGAKKWFRIMVGRLISEESRIAWTTSGHVAGDVNLYCLGPMAFERSCQGVHFNTRVNDIMTNYLEVNQQDITLKLRK